MIKTIKDAVERYGEDIYDIVNNSPSRSNAYFRGLELGGPVLAILCAVWWDNNNGNNDGIPPTSRMLLQ